MAFGLTHGTSPRYGAFHYASCEFFNMLECLLRKVLKCSEGDSFMRLGERCLEGIWSRYTDLILYKFTEGQQDTLNKLTHDIC